MGEEAKNPVGRPLSINQQVADLLVEAINKGCTYRLACDHADISYLTLYRYLKDGSGEFCNYIKRSIGKSAFHFLSEMEKNDNEWQKWAWKLERRFPDIFGPRKRESKNDSGRVTVVFNRPHQNPSAVSDSIDVVTLDNKSAPSKEK